MSIFSNKKVDTDEGKVEEILTRGVGEVIQKEELKKDLLSGKKLKIKLGIDPTSSNIHLGRAVLLLKLRDFQELGHTIVLIVGDATGVIGDTSDKESERPMLTQEQVKENSKSYFDQVGRVLDMNKVEKRFNSEWLNKLSYKEIGEHANQFSVADFIARENVSKRLKGGKRVSLREVLYPLMQGYDSVEVNANVELGGTDQRFNLLAGRTLQSYFGKSPQHILTMNLITGTDGRKMSSSWGNVINIVDEPEEMYGKVMSISDSLVEEYFVSCTRVPVGEVEKIMSDKHPKESKMRLAREIVSLFYNDTKSKEAESTFEKTFKEKEIPSDIPEVEVAVGTTLYDAVSLVVGSKSEWRRLVEGGAVEDRDGNRINDSNIVVEKDTVFKIGKRRFIKINIKR